MYVYVSMCVCVYERAPLSELCVYMCVCMYVCVCVCVYRDFSAEESEKAPLSELCVCIMLYAFIHNTYIHTYNDPDIHTYIIVHTTNKT